MHPPSPFFVLFWRWVGGERFGGSRLTLVNSPCVELWIVAITFWWVCFWGQGRSLMQAKLGTPRSVIGKNFQCPNMHTSLFSTKVSKAYSSHLLALTFPSHHLLLRNQEEKSPSHAHKFVLVRTLYCSLCLLSFYSSCQPLWSGPVASAWSQKNRVTLRPSPTPNPNKCQFSRFSLHLWSFSLSIFFRLMVGDLFNIKNMDKSYSTLLLLSTVLLILLYTTTTVYS